MFDFLRSGEDEEKRRELEENIAQIRQKVQKEERERRAEEGADYREPSQEPQQAAEQPENAEEPQVGGGPGGGREPEPPERMAEETEEQTPFPSRPQPEEESSQAEGWPSPSETEQDYSSDTQQSTSHAQDTAQGQRSSVPQAEEKEHQKGTKMSFDDVPQPPEVKDLDIPDIDKGPLFITVNKFKNALTTLSEMKQMVSDIESNIGSLENTLEEDRETEEALRNILNTTIRDTEIIQDTVLPKEE